MSNVRILGVVACMLALSGPVKAGILYDNITASTNGTDPIGGFGPISNSFSTGATGVNLTEVEVLLGNDGIPGTGTVDVTLLSDSSTSPGATLTTIGSISDSGITSSLSVFDLILGAPFALAANTRYWIRLSTADGSTANWSYSFDTSGPGVANEFFNNQSGTFDNSNGPYQMRVSASSVTAVPEPATAVLALGGVGGIGVFAYGRRRRNRAV